MDFLTALQSKDPENNLFHYLIEYGTKQRLDEMIVELEKANSHDPVYLQTILIKKFDNKLWEVPTRELCTGLVKLFKHLGIKKINELGAGMAMLSALLDHYSKLNNYLLEIDAFSKFNCGFLRKNRFTYYPVKNAEYSDYDKSEAIIVSWLHYFLAEELLDTIMNTKPKYIFLIGEHVSDENCQTCCQTDDFHEQMLDLGYKCYIIPFKQIGEMDYITDDINKLKLGLYSRSCTVMYTVNQLDANISDIVGEENLGIYLQLTKQYFQQDMKLLGNQSVKLSEFDQDMLTSITNKLSEQ
jgi:hypothetical protein